MSSVWNLSMRYTWDIEAAMTSRQMMVRQNLGEAEENNWRSNTQRLVAFHGQRSLFKHWKYPCLSNYNLGNDLVLSFES